MKYLDPTSFLTMSYLGISNKNKSVMIRQIIIICTAQYKGVNNVLLHSGCRIPYFWFQSRNSLPEVYSNLSGEGVIPSYHPRSLQTSRNHSKTCSDAMHSTQCTVRTEHCSVQLVRAAQTGAALLIYLSGVGRSPWYQILIVPYNRLYSWDMKPTNASVI